MLLRLCLLLCYYVRITFPSAMEHDEMRVFKKKLISMEFPIDQNL